MSLSNLSQVLLRNVDLLAANQPLLINFPVDGLHKTWLEEHPNASMTYFTNNKLDADSLSALNHPQVNFQLGCCYHADKKHDLAVIAFPKSKNELAYTLAMINACLEEDATVLFVGDNKGGIKSVAKLAKDYVEKCDKVDSARHCILFASTHKANDKAFVQEEWFHFYPVELNGITLKVAALPGVFSQQGLDKGTRVLLENLPTTYAGKILDFGCGAGIISAFIGKMSPGTELHMLDISALAVTSAQKTLEVNGLTGQAFCSNGLKEISGKFDHIVSNPPFHQGLKTHYQATETFLANCHKHLTNNGKLTVVANSFLKYQPIMEKALTKTQIATTERGFNVFISEK